MRHLIQLTDLSTAEIERIFAVTEDLKTKLQQGLREPLLPGRVIALLFEKPSLRTRVSFESGISHLGGSSLFLGNDVGFNSREGVGDFARVLGQYVDVIVVRCNRHQTAVDVARFAQCPVINGLTDEAHPCQALADLYTLRELAGRLAGHKVAFIGDGNNVARSLAEGCARMGMRFALASPPGYEFDPALVARLKQESPKFDLLLTHDPIEAVRDAVAVYTDVWTSMGQEAERAERQGAFAAYQVNTRLMAHAPQGAYFMHCLPAHRGEEVTDDVIDGPQSVVVQQAGNRLHVQKGVLAWILSGKS